MIDDKLIELGFYRCNSIILNHSNKTLTDITIPNNDGTDLFVYTKSDKDFIVIYPNVFKLGGKWKVSWYGDVKDILDSLKILEEEYFG